MPKSRHIVIGKAILDKMPVQNFDEKTFRNLFADQAHLHGFFYTSNPEGYSSLLRDTLKYIKRKVAEWRSTRHAGHHHTASKRSPAPHTTGMSSIGREVLAAYRETHTVASAPTD